MTTIQTFPIPYLTRKVLALALDPIHVGTGEFQLGRVDNTIVRDPGLNVPKIPASSIAGVTRAYMAMLTRDSKDRSRYLRATADRQNKESVLSCAGKGGADGMDHCGEHDCPVCTSFGFSRRKSSFQGLAMLTDARILFFPVSSLLGPVWVTSPGVLAEAMPEFEVAKAEEAIGAAANAKVWTNLAGLNEGAQLNLGWVYLPSVKTPALTFSAQQPFEKMRASRILARLAIVSDQLFPAIINDNLEVRTSVSIQPQTGTAEPGALFTAEAIPRGTVFWYNQAMMDGNFFRVPREGQSGVAPALSKEGLHELVLSAMHQMENLGVGGLNTRGMGRLRIAEWS